MLNLPFGISTVVASALINLDDFKSSIDKVWIDNGSGGVKVYNGNSAFNFALSTLNQNDIVMVKTKNAVEMPVTKSLSSLGGIQYFPVADVDVEYGGINYNLSGDFRFALDTYEGGFYLNILNTALYNSLLPLADADNGNGTDISNQESIFDNIKFLNLDDNVMAFYKNNNLILDGFEGVYISNYDDNAPAIDISLGVGSAEGTSFLIRHSL